MMPLSLADIEQDNIIRRIGGSPEVKKHLENLGITLCSELTVLSNSGGTVVCKVMDGRIALDRNLSTKIFVAISGD